MTIKELRMSMHMSQSQFAKYFNLPIRTLQEWEQERHNPPPYLMGLLERIVELERNVTADGRISIINRKEKSEDGISKENKGTGAT